jgi:uncharacterized membrane protein YqaE (UPF0057 family)
LEGPYWVGERFVMPVNQELVIGRATGHWLSLNSASLSDAHCRLHVAEDGRILVEDLESRSGTWIGSQRIIRGRLASMQCFSVGGFRFRLDLQSADGTTAIAQPLLAAPAETQPLPLTGPKRLPSLGAFLARGRFQLSRWGLVIFAWLAGVYHACWLSCRPSGPWPALAAVLMGVVVTLALVAAARKLALVHGRHKYAAVIALLLLAVVDFCWKLPGPTAAGLGLAVSVGMLMIANAQGTSAIVAAIIGCSSLGLMLVATVRGLLPLISSLR